MVWLEPELFDEILNSGSLISTGLPFLLSRSDKICFAIVRSFTPDIVIDTVWMCSASLLCVGVVVAGILNSS